MSDAPKQADGPNNTAGTNNVNGVNHNLPSPDVHEQATAPNNAAGTSSMANRGNDLPGPQIASMMMMLNDHDAQLRELGERYDFTARLQALGGNSDSNRLMVRLLHEEVDSFAREMAQMWDSIARLFARTDRVGPSIPRSSPLHHSRLSLSSGGRTRVPSGRTALPSERPQPAFPTMPSERLGSSFPTTVWPRPPSPAPPGPVGPPPLIPLRDLRVWWYFLANRLWSASNEIPLPPNAPAPTGDHARGVVYNVANPDGDFRCTFRLRTGRGTAMRAHPDVMERMLRVLAGHYSREDDPVARWWLYMGRTPVPPQHHMVHWYDHPLTVSESFTRLVQREDPPRESRWWLIMGEATPAAAPPPASAADVTWATPLDPALAAPETGGNEADGGSRSEERQDEGEKPGGGQSAEDQANQEGN
jgi:hypothetical protein